MMILAAPRTKSSPLRALLAEWVKFGTLISNTLTLILAYVLIAGPAMLLVWVRGIESIATNLTELLTGVSWAQMLLAVLAAVFACTEWSSGMSQSTFLAVPTRWPVLVGKVVVMGVIAFLVGVLGAGSALIAGRIGGVDVAGAGEVAARLVCGAGVYLAGISIIAIAVGVMVRSLVAGILSVIGFVWVLPLGLTLIPWEPIQRIVLYLPYPAGGLLISPENPDSPLTPWAGGAVLFAWAVLGAIAATLVLRARDV